MIEKLHSTSPMDIQETMWNKINEIIDVLNNIQTIKFKEPQCNLPHYPPAYHHHNSPSPCYKNPCVWS